MVEEYAKKWNPVAQLRAKYPGQYRRLESLGVDADDAMAICWQGVLKAAGRYDPTKGASFSTYAAWCVLGETTLEIAKRTARKAEPRSLVRGDFEDDDGQPLWDLLAGRTDGAAPIEASEEAHLCLSLLSPRLRQVLELRYGIVDGVSRTQPEVGLLMGISRGRVLQLEQEAMAVIRSKRKVGSDEDG